MCTYLPEVGGWRRCLTTGGPTVIEIYWEDEEQYREKWAMVWERVMRQAEREKEEK